jgi:hypothetical protein
MLLEPQAVALLQIGMAVLAPERDHGESVADDPRQFRGSGRNII